MIFWSATEANGLYILFLYCSSWYRLQTDKEIIQNWPQFETVEVFLHNFFSIILLFQFFSILHFSKALHKNSWRTIRCWWFCQFNIWVVSSVTLRSPFSIQSRDEKQIIPGLPSVIILIHVCRKIVLFLVYKNISTGLKCRFLNYYFLLGR